jgi:hypothetical protein
MWIGSNIKRTSEGDIGLDRYHRLFVPSAPSAKNQFRSILPVELTMIAASENSGTTDQMKSQVVQKSEKLIKLAKS